MRTRIDGGGADFRSRDGVVVGRLDKGADDLAGLGAEGREVPVVLAPGAAGPGGQRERPAVFAGRGAGDESEPRDPVVVGAAIAHGDRAARVALDFTRGLGHLDGGRGVREVAHGVLRPAAVGESAGVLELDPVGGLPVEIQDGAVPPLAGRAHRDPVLPEDQRRLRHVDAGREGDLDRGAP